MTLAASAAADPKPISEASTPAPKVCTQWFAWHWPLRHLHTLEMHPHLTGQSGLVRERSGEKAPGDSGRRGTGWDLIPGECVLVGRRTDAS